MLTPQSHQFLDDTRVVVGQRLHLSQRGGQIYQASRASGTRCAAQEAIDSWRGRQLSSGLGLAWLARTCRCSTRILTPVESSESTEPIELAECDIMLCSIPPAPCPQCPATAAARLPASWPRFRPEHEQRQCSSSLACARARAGGARGGGQSISDGRQAEEEQ
jgi:hypothetical protein